MNAYLRKEMNISSCQSRLRYCAMEVLSKIGFQTSRKIEYDFVLSEILFPNRRILDIGSYGSILPILMARKINSVYAFDFRGYGETNFNLTSIKGNVKSLPFRDETFDLITCVSTMEHIGLTAYGDPRFDDGDKLLLNEILRVLKKDGKIIITVPFCGKFGTIEWKSGKERIYDYSTLLRLFSDMYIKREEFYIPLGKKNWKMTNKEKAEITYMTYPRSNLACFSLIKNEQSGNFQNLSKEEKRN